MSSLSMMNFSAGLEAFGKLDWDDEFEELTSSEPTIASTPASEFHLQDNGESTFEPTDLDMSVKSDSASCFALDDTTIGGPVIATTPQPQSIDNNATPEQYDLVVVTTPKPQPIADAANDECHINQEQQLYQEPTYSDDHATPLPASDIQQSTTLHQPTSQPTFAESTSWYPHITATTPQVSLWSGSPYIFGDIKGTLDAWFYSRTIERGIPRRASILIRAIQHLYPVPHDAGIGYPIGATGRKGQRLLEVGQKKSFYPRRTRLSEMLTADDIQGGDEQVLLLEPEAVLGTQMVEEEEMVEEDGMFNEEEMEEIKRNLEEWLEEDGDDDEELHLSFEEKIEAQFEREIDGGSLPVHIVDKDTAFFYDEEPSTATKSSAKSEDSDGYSSSSSDGRSSGPLLSSSETSPESSDNSDPEDFEPTHRGPRFIAKADNVYYDSSDDEDSEYAKDDWTSQFDSEDIDEALARLEQMSMVSAEELQARKMDEGFNDLLGSFDSEDYEGQEDCTLLETASVDDVATGVVGVDKPLNPICTLFGLADLLEADADAVAAAKGKEGQTARIEVQVSASISTEVPSIEGGEVPQKLSGGVSGILSGIATVAKGFWGLLRDGPMIIE